MLPDNDTIVAQATPSGRGGVGIIRVSGSQVPKIAKAVLKQIPLPRYASYLPFFDEQDQIIDQGIAIYFPAPHSLTGESIIEFQGHGGPIVLDCLIRTIIKQGARLARPGEFLERAFLNDKIDLTQAEAIADLINADSEEAARAAVRSLQGDFSKAIDVIVQSMIKLRQHVEAAIDFPEEEIDFLSDGQIEKKLLALIAELNHVLTLAQQGSLLREGMTLVILGKPNAGKSTLLNYLSGREAAIVTDLPGTTRDILREHIQLDGLPIHVIDTAGLRESEDSIEQEGIKRAYKAAEQADHILFMVDGYEEIQTELPAYYKNNLPLLSPQIPITVIRNKIDLTHEKPAITQNEHGHLINISLKTGEGVALLKSYLKEIMGYNTQLEGAFIARRRHLDALHRAHTHLKTGLIQLQQYRAGELLAEELQQAQQALSEITGRYTADNLLGEIFLSFCIGK